MENRLTVLSFTRNILIRDAVRMLDMSIMGAAVRSIWKSPAIRFWPPPEVTRRTGLILSTSLPIIRLIFWQAALPVKARSKEHGG